MFLNEQYNEKEIDSFIDYCKSNEDQNGYLKQVFDKFKEKKSYKRTIYTNDFDIEERNSKLKILLNKVNMIIQKFK